MEIDFDNFRRLIPIDSLKSSYQNELARYTEPKELSRGETVFCQGDTERTLFYLQSGTIKLTSDTSAAQVIVAGSDDALYALPKQLPRQFTAKVESRKAVVLPVSFRLLDKMLAWSQITEDEQQGGTSSPRARKSYQDSNWMAALHKTKALFEIPSSNIQPLIRAMDALKVKTGDVIIRQGEPGDYFYIIKKGSCQVSENSAHGESVLTELIEGDSFGEEALLSGAPRNAKVTMTSHGVLMRLSKGKFKELLEEPLSKKVSLTRANQLMQQGAIRVDVRMGSEFEKDELKAGINIPLNLIRNKAPFLNKKHKYILYCDTGERSSAAAFLMNSIGLDVYVLDGGLSSIR